MNEIMPKPNKTLWMVLALIPGCGQILILGGWFAIYRSLAVINPQTSRTIGKDILITIVTCGLFGLALPYLIIKDTQEGCKTLGIDVPDYTSCIKFASKQLVIVTNFPNGIGASLGFSLIGSSYTEFDQLQLMSSIIE